MKGVLVSAGGAVTAAFGAGLCCAGPVLAAVFGAGAAGMSSHLGPLRPYLLTLSAGSLALAFWRARREPACACEDGDPTPELRRRRRLRTTMIVATVLSVVFATYPAWSTAVGLR